MAHDKKARDHRVNFLLDFWCLLTRIGRQPRMGKPRVSSWQLKPPRKVTQLPLQPSHIKIGRFLPSVKLNISSVVLIC